ncbi:hypothetical protein RvY_14993 [Ramazzottius varieornatus]|uniref:Rap1 Myb domain-containing protein n=1 Tax=Ramazzottius varieornatus TaxID=947166 RepID=A0A1D1VV06_RAMVA|nr:hypothetical protein RvY_14993 [Ramazzottius varieornatus]
MDSSDSESIFINEPIARAKTIAADRRGLSARQAAGCGMGYRKGAKTSFTVKDDMDIIKYMVQVAYPKYGYIGTWPGIVDCVAAHPKLNLPYHTAQSVHERYRKQIRKGIDGYNIPPEWKELIRNKGRGGNFVPPLDPPRYSVTPKGRISSEAGTSKAGQKPGPHQPVQQNQIRPSRDACRALAGNKNVPGKPKARAHASSVDRYDNLGMLEVASLHPVKNLGQKRRLTHLSTSEDEGPVRVKYYKVSRPSSLSRQKDAVSVVKRTKPFVIVSDDDEEQVPVTKPPQVKDKRSSAGSDEQVDEELANLKSPTDLNETLPTPLKSRLSNKSVRAARNQEDLRPEMRGPPSRRVRSSAATSKSNESSIYLDINEDDHLLKDVETFPQEDRPESNSSGRKEKGLSAGSVGCQTMLWREKKAETVDSCVGSDISFRDAACSPIHSRLLDAGYDISKGIAVQTEVYSVDMVVGQDAHVEEPQGPEPNAVIEAVPAAAVSLPQLDLVNVVVDSLEARRGALKGIGLEIIPVEEVEQEQRVLKTSPVPFATPRKPDHTERPVKAAVEVHPATRAKSRQIVKTKPAHSTETKPVEKRDPVSRRRSSPKPSTSQSLSRQAHQVSPEIAMVPRRTRQRGKPAEIIQVQVVEVEAPEVASKENAIVVDAASYSSGSCRGPNVSEKKNKPAKSLNEMLPMMCKRFQRDPAYILYVFFACNGLPKAVVNFLSTLQITKRAPETPYSFVVDRMLLREGVAAIDDLMLRTELTRPQLEERLAYLHTHQRDKTTDEAIKTVRLFYDHSEPGEV